jgi:hypothetical protein
MATQSRVVANHGDFGDGTPVVVFSYDYDDTTLRVTMFRCDNKAGRLPADHPQLGARAWGKAEMADGTRSRESFFDPNPAGAPTEIPIPTSVAQRLQLVLRPPKNTLDGVSFQSKWPA